MYRTSVVVEVVLSIFLITHMDAGGFLCTYSGNNSGCSYFRIILSLHCGEN